MTWHLAAQVGHEVRRYLLDTDAQSLVEVTRQPSPRPVESQHSLGRCGELEVELCGTQAPWGLQLTLGHRRLVIEDLHVTSHSFGHLPWLDAMAVVTGDPGSGVPRRVTLLALEPLRRALEEGRDRLQGNTLDQCSVHGAVNGIDVERPELRIWPVEGSPELICSWNIPGAQPACACLKVVELPDFQAGASLSMQRLQASPEIRLERFWLTHLFNTRDDQERLRFLLAGVGRRRRDFCLALRSLALPDPEMSLYKAAREMEWTQHQLDALLLRDSSGIQAATVLPGGTGLVLTTESPLRKLDLLHLHLSGNHLRADPLQGPTQASRLWIEREAPPAAPPKPEAHAPAVATAPEATTAPAAPVAHAPEAAASVVAAPVAAAPVRVEAGEVKVNPGGAAVPLGSWPRGALLLVQPSVVGDGRWVRLAWWLSHEPSQEEQWAYTLHLEAAREVQVRYQVAQLPTEAP